MSAKKVAGNNDCATPPTCQFLKSLSSQSLIRRLHEWIQASEQVKGSLANRMHIGGRARQGL